MLDDNFGDHSNNCRKWVKVDGVGLNLIQSLNEFTGVLYFAMAFLIQKLL